VTAKHDAQHEEQPERQQQALEESSGLQVSCVSTTFVHVLKIISLKLFA